VVRIWVTDLRSRYAGKQPKSRRRATQRTRRSSNSPLQSRRYSSGVSTCGRRHLYGPLPWIAAYFQARQAAGSAPLRGGGASRRGAPGMPRAGRAPAAQQRPGSAGRAPPAQGQAPIIVLTGHGNVPTSVRALKAGVVDFLQKPAPPKLLLERIRAALDSDRQARAVTTERAVVLERLAHLTPRVREVMELLIAGRTSKEIASALQVSVRTVEGHRRGRVLEDACHLRDPTCPHRAGLARSRIVWLKTLLAVGRGAVGNTSRFNNPRRTTRVVLRATVAVGAACISALSVS